MSADTLIAVMTGLAAFLIAVAALLRGWSGWLQLKREQMGVGAAPRPSPSPAQRIELAALKERVRRLEAIANGDG